MPYTVLLYYKFTQIENPEQFRKAHVQACLELGLTGRILVGDEGLNGTVAGLPDQTEAYKALLWADPRFEDMVFKESLSEANPFPKMKVKARKEIISLYEDRVTVQEKSEYVTPDQLQALYESGEEFYVFDTRNTYETIEGTFEGAVAPEIDNFRELPKVLDQFSELKDKKVVTVCTGGIRCEKASALLKQNGFSDVYQLEGGIVSYIHKYPDAHFEGDCYVFDDRMRLSQKEIAEGKISLSPKTTATQYR
jgi:UPF0176 protein